jgi:hypothetical protein
VAFSEIEIPWTEQPQEAAGLDAGLASGMVAAVNFATPTFNPIGRSSVFEPGYGEAVRVTTAGLGLRGFQSANYVRLNGPEILPNIITGGTFAAVVVFNAAPSGTYSFVLDTTNRHLSLAFNASFRPSYYGWAGAQNDCQGIAQIAPYEVGRPALIVMQRTTGNLLRVFTHSATENFSTSAIGTGSNNAFISFGWNSSGGGVDSDVTVLQSHAWARLLTTEEIAALYTDWLAVYEPRRIWVPQSGAAPSGPTLGTPTYVPGTLSSSGFQVRVPVTWS